MRRIILFTTVVAALTLTLLMSAHSQTPRTTAQQPQVKARTAEEQQAAVRKGITTQQRVNRYFHDTVMSKLKSCWNTIQGRGTVQIEHTYTKDAGGRWTAGKLAVTGSTLPRGQEAVALRCMQESVRGSSFAAEGRDGDSKDYVVRWTWPVPFPTDAAEQTRKMFLAQNNEGGGTGCDGKGAPAKCFTCAEGKGARVTCVKVCVGKSECTLTFVGQQIICSEAGTTCASGGPFGVAGGGVVIY